MDAEPIAISVNAIDPSLDCVDQACAAYEEERDTVLRYLLSLNAPLADAQELTQDVFLAHYLALRDGIRIGSRRAWLFTVASRKFLNWRKSAAVRTSVPLDGNESEILSIADPAGTPEASVLEDEKLAAVRQAILGLSTQQKICLNLRSQGLHYREIAGVLDISVPAVSEFLRRAVTRIRKVVHG